VATQRPLGSWCVCGPKLIAARRRVEDNLDRVNLLGGSSLVSLLNHAGLGAAVAGSMSDGVAAVARAQPLSDYLPGRPFWNWAETGKPRRNQTWSGMSGMGLTPPRDGRAAVGLQRMSCRLRCTLAIFCTAGQIPVQRSGGASMSLFR